MAQQGRAAAEVLEERADAEEAEMKDAVVRMAQTGPPARQAQPDLRVEQEGRALYALIMPP